jgi:hypothetical protein
MDQVVAQALTTFKKISQVEISKHANEDDIIMNIKPEIK